MASLVEGATEVDSTPSRGPVTGARSEGGVGGRLEGRAFGWRVGGGGGGLGRACCRLGLWNLVEGARAKGTRLECAEKGDKKLGTRSVGVDCWLSRRRERRVEVVKGAASSVESRQSQ